MAIFLHYLINGTIFEKKKVIELIMRIFILSTKSVWNIFHSKKTERNVIIIVCWSACKVPVILVSFNENGILGTQFRKNMQISISWKSVEWEPKCSMRTDRQTDITKLIIASGNFAKTRENRKLARWTGCGKRHSKHSSMCEKKRQHKCDFVQLRVKMWELKNRCFDHEMCVSFLFVNSSLKKIHSDVATFPLKWIITH